MNENNETYAINRSISLPLALYKSVLKYGINMSKATKNGIALELEQKKYLGLELTPYEEIILQESDVMKLKRRIIDVINNSEGK